MTKHNMSKEQQEKITAAIKEFYDVFYVGGVNNNSTVIKALASILLLMDRNSITYRENISNDTPFVIVKLDLAYLAGKNDVLRRAWINHNIQNKALVALISDSTPITHFCWGNIKSMSNWVNNPIKIFNFFDIISENNSGGLYYLEVLDFAISLTASRTPSGQFIQPAEFSQLASRMIDAKGKSVYNPFSGIMSYATALSGYDSFIGIEKDTYICDISKFRIQLAHLADNTFCVNGDVRSWTDKSFDIMVSTPPVGMNLMLDKDSRLIKSDWICLKNFEVTTTSNGVLFTYVLPSVLFDSSLVSRKIRQYITEKNYLDTIIELPANLLLPYSSISLVALILKKGRGENEPIKMVDASSLFTGKNRRRKLNVEAILDCLQNMPSETCIQVSIDDIRENEYIWSVSKYIKANTESFPEGYKVVTMNDVVELIRGERVFNEKKGHIAKISGLATEGADCIRSVESFEETEELSNATKITEPVILLSSIRELRPTYCEASYNSPIFINPNIWACRVRDSWVSPTYLCFELSRRLVNPTGNFIPRISRSELLGMKVAFPSIGNHRSFEEQSNLYMEAAMSLKLAKAKELGLQSIIDSTKAEYVNIVRTRKHDMMPYMRELGAFERMIRHYISKKDEMLDFSEKVIALLDKHSDSLAKLSELIDVFSEEQQFGKPEQFNINKYFVELEANHDKAVGYRIEFDRYDDAIAEYGIPVPAGIFTESGEEIDLASEVMTEENKFPLIVDINHLDFERLVRNIIENAITHGFTDSNRDDYRIGIELTVDMEKGMFQIDFSNNGTPLPTGMNKYRYGILGEKAGMTGKTGRGGYIVKSIVEHFHGDYDVFMDGINTVVRILLPIAKYDYE